MARLSHFRPVGSAGEPYPSWLDKTRGKSGVYAIKSGNTLVYVGESHSDRLYETLTRHLQRWELEEAKSYPRSSCSVAFTLCHRDEAPALQAHYICELAPRDNVYEQCEAVPF